MSHYAATSHEMNLGNIKVRRNLLKIPFRVLRMSSYLRSMRFIESHLGGTMLTNPLMDPTPIPSTSAILESPNDTLRPPMRGWIILAGLAAIGLFVLAVAILYVQWLRNENPNASIVIQAESRLDEATVVVRPLGGSSHDSIIAQFKTGQNHRLHFHVPPGAYNITVRDIEGKLLFPERPDLEYLLYAMKPLYIRLKLNSPIPPSKSTSSGGATH